MYPIHIITQEKRDLITNEIQKWNSLEQTALIVENLKLLSFNLVKLVASYCSDLIEQKQQLYHSNNMMSSSFSSTPNSPTMAGGGGVVGDNSSSLDYFVILEEQANDPLYFHVLKEKPVETRLKLLISYLPLLKSTDSSTRSSQLRPIYYEFINDIFSQSVTSNNTNKVMQTSSLGLFECYQLALLASMHPIFDYKQRVYFKKWLTLFEMKILNENKTELLTTNASGAGAGLFVGFGGQQQQQQSKDPLTSFPPSNQLLFSSNPTGGGPSSSSSSMLLLNNNFTDLNNNTTNINSLLDMSTQQELSNQLSSFNTFSDLINELSSCSSTTSTASSSRPAARNSSNNDLLKSSLSFPSALSSLSSLASQANLIENSFLSNNFDQLLLAANSDNNKYCDIQLMNHQNNNSQNLLSSMSGDTSTNNNSSPPPHHHHHNHHHMNFELNEKALVTNNNDGMENVYHWLKSLRLHKYAVHFGTLTYDQMLNLNDEQLISLNITLGARKKILANIEKIKKRRERLEEIKKLFETHDSSTSSLLTVFSLLEILNELYELAIGPMKSQNKSPTSVNYLTDHMSMMITGSGDARPNMSYTNGHETSSSNSRSNSETVIVTKLFVEILEIAQRHIIRQYAAAASAATSTTGITTDNQREDQGGETVHDLIVIYLRTIDKLFLTKGFADIQQAQLSKMRNHLCEKTQTFKIDSSKKITKKKMLATFSTTNTGTNGNGSGSSNNKQVSNGADHHRHVNGYMSMSNWPPSSTRRSSVVVGGGGSGQTTPSPIINRPTFDRTLSSPFGTTNRTFNFPDMGSSSSSQNGGGGSASALNNNRANIFQPYTHFQQQRDDSQISYESKS